jgi:hypothetical protein
MNRPSDRLLIAALALSALAGCANTPRYRWPQGFSGSYHRALFGEVRPSAMDQPPTETAAVAAPDGVFYPPGLSYRTPPSPPTRFAVIPPMMETR